MKRPESLTQIGVITAAHGIRGQVKLRSFTHDPEAIFQCHPVTDKHGQRQFSLKREGIKDQLYIASIDGITDRNAAEMLKGTELYAAYYESSSPDEDQWLYSDLKGLEARTMNSVIYGKVVEVYNFGAGDIIEIKKPDGSLEMLPFKKEFVGEINIERGFLEVFPPNYVEGSDDE